MRSKKRPHAAKRQGTDQRSRSDFSVVGVGASAGGLEAFSQLLQGLPADTGMAFVLVQHLDPDHPSALAHLLGLKTRMPVVEVSNGVVIEPNKVYVIPQNTSMTIANRVLRLQPRGKKAGAHLPIDQFFESLAHDQQERAIGVILSGSASDGTQGLETIKAEGGITFAQDHSAKFDSMPRSAEAAGCVDFVLAPEQIAREIANIAKHPLPRSGQDRFIPPPGENRAVPARKLQSRGPPDKTVSADRSDEDAFRRILLLLRNLRRVDFSLYKPNTIHRRIARRMVLGRKETLAAYENLLIEDEKELGLLYLDVLIGVTSFFRNPQAFETLKQEVFPALLNLPERRDEPVRVWVPGCSTGQEAYSIAIAFNEFSSNIPRAPKIQIFATDLNESALEKARRGLYSKVLVTHVSQERLARFFTEEQGGFRVNKSLRDSCIFARQNVLCDPPFSRIDLISCRNMMIYVELESQKKILPNFQYALKPGGFLLLGASESIGTFTELFAVVDKKSKLYSRKTSVSAFARSADSAGASGDYRPPQALPAALPNRPQITRGAAGGSRDLRRDLEVQRIADRVSSSRFAPPSVIVDSDLQILQFRGITSRYLESPPGKPSFDLLKMACEGLMLPLRAAFNKAKSRGRTVRTRNVRVTQNGRSRRVNIEVMPLKEMANGTFLIFFEEAEGSTDEIGPSRPQHAPGTRRREEPARLRELELELSEARAYLQSTQEQNDSTNEELQAANEEAQSANEELQSSNEELETSKEELESTNEELTTVNEEMASRNTELSHLNSDLINLQNSTKLAIVLLGRDLTVRRISPRAETHLKFALSDLGRPIGSVRHNLDLVDLEDFVAEVIGKAQEREREVRDREGRWYSLRVRPYLTGDQRVDGAIIVLVEIDELKKKEALITEARGRAEAVIETIPDPLLILNRDLTIYSANQAFYRTFKLSTAETETRALYDLPDWDLPALRERLEKVIPANAFFNELEVLLRSERIGARSLLIDARPLANGSDRPQQILVGIRDITDVLAFQVQLRRSELRYRRLFEAAHDGVLLIDPSSRKIIAANPFITNLLGYEREELSGKELFEVGLLKDRAASEAAFRELQVKGRIRYEHLPLETKAGQTREVEFVSNLYTEDGEKVIQCNIRDITERKLAEQKFRGLLESAPDAVIISDTEGNISLINAQTEKMFGYGREELVGRPVEFLVPPRFDGNSPDEPDPFRDSAGQREIGLKQYLSGRRKNGTEFPIEMSLSRVDTDTGWLSMAALRDITQRKQAEEALRASEERYRTLFTSIDEGFCVIGMLFDDRGNPIDFTFLEVNPSFEKQTGIQDAPGKRIREITPTLESFWFETYGKVAKTGEPVRFVQEAKALNRWFDVYAFRLGLPHDCKVALIFQDITHHKVAEKALRAAQTQLADRADKLERAVAERTSELTSTNNELEAFVYSIAHDLRAPLRSMQGFSDMLLDECGTALSEGARDYARRIGASAETMDALLRDLVAFSGISEQQIDLIPLNLQNVLKLAVASLENEIHEKNAVVQVIGAWPNVFAHEATVGPVLVHLLGNAIRFVAPNVAPHVRLRAEERETAIRVWVEDNGIGIDAGHKDEIFKLFTRLHGDKYGGTGIGLAMVKKAVERMGGQVGVDTTPRQGSRFWFELKKA